jgi:hypothetical protein
VFFPSRSRVALTLQNNVRSAPQEQKINISSLSHTSCQSTLTIDLRLRKRDPIRSLNMPCSSSEHGSSKHTQIPSSESLPPHTQHRRLPSTYQHARDEDWRGAIIDILALCWRSERWGHGFKLATAHWIITVCAWLYAAAPPSRLSFTNPPRARHNEDGVGSPPR